MSNNISSVKELLENLMSPRVWIRVIIFISIGIVFVNIFTQLFGIFTSTNSAMGVSLLFLSIINLFFSSRIIRSIDLMIWEIINMPTFTICSKVSNFIYSNKTQKDTFEPIVADWQEEYFEALFKNEIWKARWINVRYTYAFVVAMWQKSPIGDLIEFVRKIAS